MNFITIVVMLSVLVTNLIICGYVRQLCEDIDEKITDLSMLDYKVNKRLDENGTQAEE